MNVFEAHNEAWFDERSDFFCQILPVLKAGLFAVLKRMNEVGSIKECVSVRSQIEILEPGKAYRSYRKKNVVNEEYKEREGREDDDVDTCGSNLLFDSPLLSP